MRSWASVPKRVAPRCSKRTQRSVVMEGSSDAGLAPARVGPVELRQRAAVALLERRAAALLGAQHRVGEELRVVGAQQVRLLDLQVAAHAFALAGIGGERAVGLAVPVPAQAELVEGGVECAT